MDASFSYMELLDGDSDGLNTELHGEVGTDPAA